MKAQLTIAAAVATVAGSIGLYPLFVSAGWFWTGLGAVLVVSGAGALIRRYRLPALINLAGGLGALLLYVTVVYAPGEALLGIIPTPDSIVRLGNLIDEGWHAANTYAAPVPLISGIALLSTLGIGLVAVLVDLLAVRLRRAAPAGLPLLAMYSVPAAIREESISWLAFGIGAAGYLWLLLADARVQVVSWGRPVFTSRWSDETPREQPSSSALALTGRRIGLTAVAAAVLLPAIVPGIQPKGFFGMGGTGTGGHGARTVTTLDPLVSLKRELTRTDDAEVLTFRTNDPQPDYLRLYALDRFDGDRWTYSELSSGPKDKIKNRDLPPAPGLTIQASGRIQTKISIDDHVELKFLPMPYPPTRVDIDGDWRVHAPSLMVYSLRDAAGGRDYTVDSLKVAPTPAQLEAAPAPPTEVEEQFTRVPPNIPDSVRRIADDVTHSATTSYDKAVLLQDWFTNGQFTYTTDAPPPQRVSDLVDFLEKDKAGYCEQFAASMALMARLLKIPARVAMGYTPGVSDDKGNHVVRSRDTHAWPELYFSGIGWVRFEPTPGGPTGQGTATVPQYAVPPTTNVPGASTAPNTSSSPTTASSPSAAPSDLNKIRDPNGLGTAAGTSKSGGTRIPWAWIAVGLGVLVIALVPLMARLLIRRRRWALVPAVVPSGDAESPPGADVPERTDGDGDLLVQDTKVGQAAMALRAEYAAHAAWAELRADAIDYGVEWRPAESPRAVAKRLAVQLNLGGTAADALTRITMAEERARYAPTPSPTATLRADSRLMRQTFASTADRWTRIKAIFFPPSTMAAFRAAGARMIEALDRLDSLAFSPRPLRRLRGGSRS